MSYSPALVYQPARHTTNITGLYGTLTHFGHDSSVDGPLWKKKLTSEIGWLKFTEARSGVHWCPGPECVCLGGESSSPGGPRGGFTVQSE